MPARKWSEEEILKRFTQYHRLRGEGVRSSDAAIDAGFTSAKQLANWKYQHRELYEKAIGCQTDAAPKAQPRPKREPTEREAAQIAAVEKVRELRAQGVPGGRAAIEAGFSEPGEYLATKAILEFRGLIEKEPEMKIPMKSTKPEPKPKAPEAIAGMEPIPDIDKQYPVGEEHPAQREQREAVQNKTEILLTLKLSAIIIEAARAFNIFARQFEEIAHELQTDGKELQKNEDEGRAV